MIIAVFGPSLSTTEGETKQHTQKKAYKMANATFPRPGIGAAIIESACIWSTAASRGPRVAM
jgi:hypothetical protein